MNFHNANISRAMNAASKLTVKSALNPALWLCGIISVPAMITAAILNPAPIWLITIACTPVGVSAVGYTFLLLFDRDRLHSEDYQIRKQSLELIEQKGDLYAVDASTIEAIAITNPLAITDHTKEEKE